jgi:hypothetical protein
MDFVIIESSEGYIYASEAVRPVLPYPGIDPIA